MRGPTDDRSEWLGGPPAIADSVARLDTEHGSRLRRVNTGLAGAVLATIAVAVAFRGINNQPGAMASELATAYRWLGVTGPGIIAALTVLVGVTRQDAPSRIGLVFAGVFGLIGLHVPAASLPAVGAIAAGVGLVIVDHLRDSGWNSPTAVGAVVWLGLGLSLASATGVLAGVRPVASTVALVGIALLPIAFRPPSWAWVGGAVAAAVVLWVGWVSPFVTGAVVLVAFGVVGAPMAAVAAAAGGGLAGLAGGLSRADTAGLSARWPGAIAAGLLLAAGVPATIPRALAAGVGIVLLVGGDAA